MMDVKFV